MKSLRTLVLGLSVLTLGGASALATTPAAEPPIMVAWRADYRTAIRSTPILERPNRVGHVYGNTVRRLHYVGNGLSGVYVP